MEVGKEDCVLWVFGSFEKFLVMFSIGVFGLKEICEYI